MKNVEEFLCGVHSMGIAGHLRPDGDAVGTVMALYLYVKEYHPEIEVDAYLDHPRPVFGHIDRIREVRMTEPEPDKVYDLFVTCDVSARDRLSVGAGLFARARRTVCIDHHVSNTGFADINHIRGDISSCSEVLYGLMDQEKVTRPIATAIYTGMIHDTGVFQYGSTTPETMRIAAKLMETGFPFNRIIDDSFYRKTYIQNQVMGRVLAESIMLMDCKVIAGYLRRKDMIFYGVTGQDMEGIVNQLRLTEGIEVAIFTYELETQRYKVSLRSNGRVDVSVVASYFGGGGHERAAGCDLSGTAYDVINNLTAQIALQLPEAEA
ncbi:MAG: bifunctional oligoribonuclease/PAP phosphatase NrnA [Blautia sp.]|nr:bifunctional oligoribonuclease/PAP phosphatase NrnA [Blautia sp.]